MDMFNSKYWVRIFFVMLSMFSFGAIVCFEDLSSSCSPGNQSSPYYFLSGSYDAQGNWMVLPYVQSPSGLTVEEDSKGEDNDIAKDIKKLSFNDPIDERFGETTEKLVQLAKPLAPKVGLVSGHKVVKQAKNKTGQHTIIVGNNRTHHKKPALLPTYRFCRTELNILHKMIHDSGIKQLSWDTVSKNAIHYCHSTFASLNAQEKIQLFKNICFCQNNRTVPLMAYCFIDSLFVAADGLLCKDFLTDGRDYEKAPLAIAYNFISKDNYILIKWMIDFYIKLRKKGLSCGDPAMVQVDDVWTILEAAMISNNIEVVKYLLDYPRIDFMAQEIIKVVHRVEPFCNLSEDMKALLNRYGCLSR